MIVLFDHMAATLVTAALLLIAGALHIRAQQSSVERTMLYTAKKQTLEFADVLVRDLSNLGYEMPADESITTLTTDAEDRTIAFGFKKQDPSTGSVVEITYQLVPRDTVNTKSGHMVLYEWQRYENGTLYGSSAPRLTDFQVDVLDDDGNTVAAPYVTARQIRLRLAVSVLGPEIEGYTMSEIYWGTTLRPGSLGNGGTAGGGGSGST